MASTKEAEANNLLSDKKTFTFAAVWKVNEQHIRSLKLYPIISVSFSCSLFPQRPVQNGWALLPIRRAISFHFLDWTPEDIKCNLVCLVCHASFIYFQKKGLDCCHRTY